jgi:glycine cleavage system H protein
VLEVNSGLEDAPELVNKDPYGEGWLIKISVANIAELDELMDAAAYKAMLEA